LKENFKIKSILSILIRGMGNVKHGDWIGILLYCSVILLIGLFLFLVERRFISQYYQVSQTVRTFLILIYTAFAIFWDGSSLLGEQRRGSFQQTNGSLSSEKD
jgi:hypothetical protein